MPRRVNHAGKLFFPGPVSCLLAFVDNSSSQFTCRTPSSAAFISTTFDGGSTVDTAGYRFRISQIARHARTPSRRMSIEWIRNEEKQKLYVLIFRKIFKSHGRRDKIVTDILFILWMLKIAWCAWILIYKNLCTKIAGDFRNWKAARISRYKIIKHFRGVFVIRSLLASPEKRKINSWARRVARERQNCTAGSKLTVDVGREENEAEKWVDLPYRPDSTTRGNF